MEKGWVIDSAREAEYISRKTLGYIGVCPDGQCFVTVRTGIFYNNKYGVLVGRNSKTVVDKFVESVEEAKALVEGIAAEKEAK
jgi:hypothetical protein